MARETRPKDYPKIKNYQPSKFMLPTSHYDKEKADRAVKFIENLCHMKFQRDIYKDLRTLEKSVGDNSEESSNLDMFSLEMFENIAFVMAKHADASIPNTPEEWLDGFNTFSIYQVLPQLIELWGLNVQTDVEAKKNFARQTVR